jgi:type II secretory pathway pseudopilin PulG
MIFYTKLKKLKKLNKRSFSPSFTFIEVLIVVIIIGILISSISFNLSPDKLNLAADELIKNIEFAQSLALKDDKYQPFPNDNNEIEYNRSKYWFKQWWQVRFSKNTTNDNWWYEIFSDIPYKSYNFDRTGRYPYSPAGIWYSSIATDFNGKLLIGNCNVTHYPSCDKVNLNLNLTKTFGITNIKFENFYSRSPRLIFDNYGNIFLKEGEKGDGKDINPLDKDERMLLTKIAKIKLYSRSGRCIQVNITPTGEIYKSKCD